MENYEKAKIWGVRCEVPSCRASKRQSPYLSFYGFPKRNSDLFKRWVAALGLTEPPKPKKAYVCSKHFSSSQRLKKRLRKEAIPSLHLSNEASVAMIASQSDSLANEPEYNITSENTLVDTDSEHIPVLFSGKCYSRPKPDVLSIQDLGKYEPRCSEFENTAEIEFSCSSCLKKEKDLKYYRSLCNKLQKENMDLKQKLRKKSVKIKTKKYAQKLRNMERKKVRKQKCLENVIDSTSGISNESKTFAKMLLCKRSKNKPWNDDARILAQNLHYKSPSAYKYLQNACKFQMPSIASIYNWLPVKNVHPGFDLNIKDQLKGIISEWDVERKQAILIFDEMTIKRELNYDVTKDEIVGFADLGNIKSSDVADHICVFMARAIFGNWKLVISYYGVSNVMKADILEDKIRENIDYATDIGLDIKAVVCDQGSNNRKAMKRMKVTKINPFFEHNDKRVYGIYDAPHLFKSIRNTIIRRNITCSDGTITWKVVEELFDLERNSNTRMFTKLSPRHVYPNTWQKMKVSYAVQVMSHTCSAAIRTAHSLNQFSNQPL